MKNTSFEIKLDTNQTEFPRGKRAKLNVYEDAMEVDMQRVTLKLCYPMDKPNKNGTVFTREALRNAFSEAQTKRLPLVDYTQDNKGKIIGVATTLAFYETYDDCSISNDCFFFDDTYVQEYDIEYMINKSHKDQDGIMVIDDFIIMGMSIVEDKI